MIAQIQFETTPLHYWGTYFEMIASKTELGPQDLNVTAPTLADLRNWMGGDLGVVDFWLFTVIADTPACDCAPEHDPGSRFYHGTAQLRPEPVPEPGTITLLVLGLGGLVYRRRVAIRLTASSRRWRAGRPASRSLATPARVD